MKKKKKLASSTTLESKTWPILPDIKIFILTFIGDRMDWKIVILKI